MVICQGRPRSEGRTILEGHTYGGATRVHRKRYKKRHFLCALSLFPLVLFPINNTLCALRQTVHGNLASECYGALLRLHSAAAVGGAIISISAGALALTLPDITVQCPTLFSCQEKTPSVFTLQGHALLPLDSSSPLRVARGRR